MKMVKQKMERAFTLVELLVVIAIIALLLAILMPALSKVRDQAKMIFCATRLKDIGMAFSLYANANNNVLPSSRKTDDGGLTYGRWPTKVAPYYIEAQKALEKSNGASTAALYLGMFHCPTQEKKYKGDAPGTYGYNVFFSDYDSKGTTFNWRRLTDIKQPSELPLLSCTNGDAMAGVLNNAVDVTGGGGGLLMFYFGPHPLAQKYGFIKSSTGPIFGWPDVGGPAPNHRGKCNFVFADFHVESRNICKRENWPWFGKLDGAAFHPKRNPSIKPPVR